MTSPILSSPLKVAEAEQWVREGVCDPLIAQQLFALVEEVLSLPEQHSALELGLSMHYIRGLSGRHLLMLLSEALSRCHHHDEHIQSCWMDIDNPLNEDHPTSPWYQARLNDEQRRDGVSTFAPMNSLYARSSLGKSALVLIADLAPPGHPAKQQALQYASAHLSLYTELSDSLDPSTRYESHEVPLIPWLTSWLWDHVDIRDELTPLLPHASRCVQGSEQRQQALAIRLALIRPQDAEEICQALQSLEFKERQNFAKLLEKQLKRVGKIRLWVACRQLLLHTHK